MSGNKSQFVDGGSGDRGGRTHQRRREPQCRSNDSPSLETIKEAIVRLANDCAKVHAVLADYSHAYPVCTREGLDLWPVSADGRGDAEAYRPPRDAVRQVLWRPYG